MIVAALTLSVATPASAIEVGVGIGGIGASVGIGGHGSSGTGSDSGSATGTSGSDVAADVSVNDSSLASARVDLNGKRGAQADVALGQVSDGKNGAVIGLSLGRAASPSSPAPATPNGSSGTNARADGQGAATVTTSASLVGHVVKARDGTVLGIVEQARSGPGKTVDMRMQVASTLGLSAPTLNLRVTPASAKDGILALNMNEAQFKRQVQ
ncbi:MAG: hypothetical protein VXW58_09365 [Pseudomonadota bacterium]|nr:hypothetical protein [Pseudomonadota bacterium]